MSIRSMMMAVAETVQETPIEYGNDGAEWGNVFILLFVIPIISFIISFIILIKVIKIKQSPAFIGTIIGSIVAFILGLGIPLPIESRSPFIILLSTKIPGYVFFPAVLVYCVVISVVIGLLINQIFRKKAKDNETKI